MNKLEIIQTILNSLVHQILLNIIKNCFKLIKNVFFQ